jgi:hypothetical protein
MDKTYGVGLLSFLTPISPGGASPRAEQLRVSAVDAHIAVRANYNCAVIYGESVLVVLLFFLTPISSQGRRLSALLATGPRGGASPFDHLAAARSLESGGSRARLGLGRIAALYDRSSNSHRIR